jgi:CheY-like chemotaxis protein
MYRLLIVDDEPAIVMVLHELLPAKLREKSVVVQVDTAVSSNGAITLIEKQVYHCLVLDATLGHASAMDLVKLDRRLGRQTPFVLFTGRDLSDQMDEIGRLGGAFIRKCSPRDLDRLVETIHGQLMGKLLVPTPMRTPHEL